MTYFSHTYATDAILKRVSETRFLVACGRRGCPQMLGFAIRGDVLMDELYIVPDAQETWYEENADDIGYGEQYVFEHNSPTARAEKEWYLFHEKKAYRADGGEYHIVEMTRGRPRRPLPKELVEDIEANRVQYADKRGVIGQRILLPALLHCPACKKRFADTINRVRVP